MYAIMTNETCFQHQVTVDNGWSRQAFAFPFINNPKWPEIFMEKKDGYCCKDNSFGTNKCSCSPTTPRGSYTRENRQLLFKYLMEIENIIVGCNSTEPALVAAWQQATHVNRWFWILKHVFV